MKARYHLHVNNRLIELNLEHENRGENLTLHMDGVSFDFHVKVLSENCYGVSTDEIKQSRVFVVNTGQGKEIFWQGRVFHIRPHEEVKRATRKGAIGGDDTSSMVTPPMPSIVRRILVQEGDSVEKGQPLIVVTSMKMETTLVSPKSGKIKRINTEQGAKVSPGDELVEFHEEED
jgi:biotin carboxyl carrier protein